MGTQTDIALGWVGDVTSSANKYTIGPDWTHLTFAPNSAGDAMDTFFILNGVKSQFTLAGTNTSATSAAAVVLFKSAVAGTPPIAELERLGVARVSIGSGAMRACMGLTQRIANELRDRGTFSSLTDGAMPFADANALFR